MFPNGAKPPVGTELWETYAPLSSASLAIFFTCLALLYRLCGDRIANRKLRTGLKNPLICMTNIGVLDAARLSFGDLRRTNAYLCGSIKYKPYFQLAMSSYQDELTLSVNLYGSASDRARIISFLKDIDA
jgi:NRPS condensation-like uncharacterized protein